MTEKKEDNNKRGTKNGDSLRLETRTILKEMIDIHIQEIFDPGRVKVKTGSTLSTGQQRPRLDGSGGGGAAAAAAAVISGFRWRDGNDHFSRIVCSPTVYL